jgi:hypothetical protein
MNNSCQNLPLPRVLRDLRDYETASRDTCSCELQASMFLSVSRTEHINWRYRGRVLSHASSLELSDRFRWNVVVVVCTKRCLDKEMEWDFCMSRVVKNLDFGCLEFARCLCARVRTVPTHGHTDRVKEKWNMVRAIKRKERWLDWQHLAYELPSKTHYRSGIEVMGRRGNNVSSYRVTWRRLEDTGNWNRKH